MALWTSGFSRSATLRVAITLATALLGAALLPGLLSARTAQVGLIWSVASAASGQQA